MVILMSVANGLSGCRFQFGLLEDGQIPFLEGRKTPQDQALRTSWTTSAGMTWSRRVAADKLAELSEDLDPY